MKFYLFLAITILVTISFIISCDSKDPKTGTVFGVVSDGTRAAVVGATASIGDQSELTDENGKFILFNVPLGQQTLSISGGGYTSYVVEIEVEEGNNNANDYASFTLSRVRSLALDLTNQKMYFNTNQNLYRSDLDGQNLEDITPADGVVHNPNGLALDLNNKKLYWTNVNKTIYRADLDAKVVNAEDITPDVKITSPGSIALDVDNQKMYFATNKEIYQANLDGTEPLEITPTKKTIPNGIALDLTSLKIYWTNNGNKIYCADLDGQNAQDITPILKPKGPNGIALDLTNQKMYWTNSGNKIYRSNLNGESAEDITPVGDQVVVSPNGVGLDVPNNYMYWCNSNSTIYRATLDGQNPEDITPTLIATQLIK